MFQGIAPHGFSSAQVASFVPQKAEARAKSYARGPSWAMIAAGQHIQPRKSGRAGAVQQCRKPALVRNRSEVCRNPLKLSLVCASWPSLQPVAAKTKSFMLTRPRSPQSRFTASTNQTSGRAYRPALPDAPGQRRARAILRHRLADSPFWACAPAVCTPFLGGNLCQHIIDLLHFSEWGCWHLAPLVRAPSQPRRPSFTPSRCSINSATPIVGRQISRSVGTTRRPCRCATTRRKMNASRVGKLAPCQSFVSLQRMVAVERRPHPRRPQRQHPAPRSGPERGTTPTAPGTWCGRLSC